MQALSAARTFGPVPDADRTAILIADDDDAVRESLARYLTRLGYDVTEAADGVQALDLLTSRRFASLISDIMMPRMTGDELVPRAVAADPDLAIIMLTAVGEPHHAVQCLKHGAMDYLIKPVDLEELGLALQFALRKRDLEIERRDLEAWLAREVALKTREIDESARQVEALALEVLEALVDAVETPGPDGSNASQRVAALAERVARELALPEEEAAAVRTAARLHSLGKLALREERVRRVSHIEITAPTSAPELATRILAPLTHHAEVLRILRAQHERWDGKGFPVGLRGEAIPAGARILAAVVLYDELTGTSAEHKLSARDAVDSLRPLGGTLFDPRVVDALSRAVGAA